MSHSRRPAETEYAPFYRAYVALVPDGDVRAHLQGQQETFRQLASVVAADRETYRYADGKWSVREVVGHLTDAVRVFGHRAFCFSRGEEAALPGFDENLYVERSSSDSRPLAELAAELAAVREVNLWLFRSLPDAIWDNVGVANGRPVSVRALAWVLAGHANHHFGVLRDRYGIAV
jgi:hypothetical protein